MGRALALLAAVGPVYYIVLTTVLGMMWQVHDPIRDTQSELGAVDSPYRTIMNGGGFMVLGVCILAFVMAYAALLRGRWVKWLAVALLTVAGTGMVVVGFFPVDPGCVDVTATGRLHGTFSAPGAIGLPAGAMLSASVFRANRGFGVTAQMASFWMGLLTLASGPIVALGLVDDALGLLQRAGMWTPLAWMTAVAIRMFLLASPSRQPAQDSLSLRNPKDV